MLWEAYFLNNSCFVFKLQQFETNQFAKIISLRFSKSNLKW